VNGAVSRGALGLLPALPFWGQRKTSRLRRNGPRRYGSGTPVLVRAEKRLYQGKDSPPLHGASPGGAGGSGHH
jgi:hypothetical protein